MSDLMNAALTADVAKAREVQYQLFPLMQSMFFDTNPVPAKKALELMGKIKSGAPRQPLWEIGADALARLTPVLKAQGLI